MPFEEPDENSSQTYTSLNAASHPDIVTVPVQGRRRASILDAGGVSSINNFASSVERSVQFLSTSIESDHSERLTPHQQDENIDVRLNESTPDYGTLSQAYNKKQLHNHYNSNLTSIKSRESDHFVPDEVLPIQPVKIISNKSTPMQTTFNSINVLIGLGVLSIPLALHLSGWFFGILFLTLSAFTTNRTAILIGRMLKKHHTLQTYHDLGVNFLGKNFGLFISVLFIFDLFGAGLSMILLFADSFNALFPEITKTNFKILLCLLLVFLNYLPLRILSFLSISGIICTSLTCLIIGVSGLLKATSPGSLLSIMPTNLWPTSSIDLLFSLGLFLAPWGGHATFPEIYRDQLYPEAFDSCMNKSFSFSYSVDLLTGLLGFLMFGKSVKDEITENILSKNDQYPMWISYSLVGLMGLLPISKLPLVCKPLTTITDNHSSYILLNRLLLSTILCTISIYVVEFGSVLSLLGSGICFGVCVCVPCFCYGGKWNIVGIVGAFLGVLGVYGVLAR